jgi:hypothetical protein
LANRQRPCKRRCLRPGYTRGRRSAVRQPERIALRRVNSYHWNSYSDPGSGVTDFCRCELPRLLPPICAASQCFYSDGVGHKKSKKHRRNRSKCRFYGHRRTFSAVPGFCRLRDYSALRASPLTGPPCGRSTSLRDVVEPIFFMSGVRPTC